MVQLSPDEFIETCINSGYVTGRNKKKRLKEWVDNHPKDTYTESDFIDVYRYFETPKHGEDVPWSKWRYMEGGHKTTKHYDV